MKIDWIVVRDLLIKTALGVSGAGVFVFPDSPLGIICAISVIASVIASCIKDGNIKPVMKIINLLASNVDKAVNDPKQQGLK